MLHQVFLSGFPQDRNLTTETAAKKNNEDFRCLTTWKTTKGATGTEINAVTRQVVISDDSQEYRDEIDLEKQGSHPNMKAKCTSSGDANMFESNTTRIGSKHEDMCASKKSSLQSNTVKEEQAYQSVFAQKKNKASSLSNRSTWDARNTVEISMPANKEERDCKIGLFQTESKWMQSQKPHGLKEYDTCISQFRVPAITKREVCFAKDTWQGATDNADLTDTANKPCSPSRFYCKRNIESPIAKCNITQPGSENEKHVM